MSTWSLGLPDPHSCLPPVRPSSLGGGGSESDGKGEAETQRPGWGQQAGIMRGGGGGRWRGGGASEDTANPFLPRGSPHHALWPWQRVMGELPDTPFCCSPRLNFPKGGAGGQGLPVHLGSTQPLPNSWPPWTLLFGPGPQSPHPSNGQRLLEELAMGQGPGARHSVCPAPLPHSLFPPSPGP